MVFLVVNPNFADASCCSVEVVKGGAGDFLVGFFSNDCTLKFAPIFFCRKASASACVLKLFDSEAFTIFPSEVVNSAVILYDD